MSDYLSEVSYQVIEPMTVLSGIAIGSEPEDEIIAKMNRLAEVHGIDVKRYFGFDSPVEGSTDVQQLRGYEYWLSVDESELEKLPEQEAFAFEGTEIQVKHIPSFKYATLIISDPFSDPFERICGGWRTLGKWVEDQNFEHASQIHADVMKCLEEVKEVDGLTVMELFIPVELA